DRYTGAPVQIAPVQVRAGFSNDQGSTYPQSAANERSSEYIDRSCRAAAPPREAIPDSLKPRIGCGETVGRGSRSSPYLPFWRLPPGPQPGEPSAHGLQNRLTPCRPQRALFQAPVDPRRCLRVAKPKGGRPYHLDAHG